MKDQTVIELGLHAILLAAKLCAPLLLTSLAIGFGISLFQSVTQIQEATLSFVPKAIGIGIVIVVCGNWMLHELVSFTTDLYTQIPTLLQTG
jgi:flagellar biosynthetic protein FliQ